MFVATRQVQSFPCPWIQSAILPHAIGSTDRVPHHSVRLGLQREAEMMGDSPRIDDGELIPKRDHVPLSRSSFLSLLVATALTASSSKPTTAALPPDQDSVCTGSSEIVDAKKRSRETLEESISGFLSGGALSATKTVVKYPLDTATVRLQMPGTAYSLSDLPSLFDESFRGISAPLLSNIPAGAVFFAVKDAVKSALKGQGIPMWLTTSLAVAAAQAPYWAIRNPSEVVKTRQQARVDGYGEGVPLTEAFQLAMSKEGAGGIRELYVGYSENIIYAFPADVLKFLCYERLSGGKKNLAPSTGAVYGAFSTAFAQMLTTPLDVVRNRIMAGEQAEAKECGKSVQGSNKREQVSSKFTYIENLSIIARQEGIKGLFAGVSPRIGKAALSGAIQFATYEETKQSISKLFERYTF